MLLGSTGPNPSYHTEEIFICQLIGEEQFAEAYTLLRREAPDLPGTQFNLALCFYWVENYKEAIACLDRAFSQLPVSTGSSNLNADEHDNAIRHQQNQTDVYRLPVTQKYISLFILFVRDAIIRLKTDCWLHLNDFAKVVETATPLAHKNYRNINVALQTAKNKLNV